MSKSIYAFSWLFLWCSLQALSQWDPHAGLYPHLSHQPEVTLEATSGLGTLSAVNDSDPGTQWVSTPTLPTKFLLRQDLNAFADQSAYTVSSSSAFTLNTITDGSLYGMIGVKADANRAWVHFTFNQAQDMIRLYGRLRTYHDPISIYAVQENGDSTLIGEVQSGRYAWEYWLIPGEQVKRIAIYSPQDFQINELGGLIDTPTEIVTMDLGSIEAVKTVCSRHWSTAAQNVLFYTSQNNVDWTFVANLDPTEQNTQTLTFETPQDMRYLRFVYEMKLLNYKKAYLWEVKVLDPTAPYGAMPTASQSPYSLYELLGVNSFWGWGYNRYTDQLQPGEGPEMYSNLASYARDYHNMNWDVVDPDDPINFYDMAATGGTPAQWWLDWEREYAAWTNKGMPVQATIQFSDFADTAWTNPFQSAYDYGYEFGRFFGPTHGNGQIEIVEVGNEPWKYDSILYRDILRGMASGLKAADPALIVLPCALQADDPTKESTSNKNYLGARVTAAEAPYLDGINLHMYSFYKGLDGVRRAVHPEHLGSGMRGILNAMRWRDQNMPGKPIYVTEWGWDHDGATQACHHNECVPEHAATAYIVRALLMMQRMGLEQSIYFYHANLWGMTLFTRSGLTGGKEVNFIKKRSYYALEALIGAVGDKHFLSVLQEDDQAWAYVLGDADGTPTHIAAWRPVDGDDTLGTTVYLPTSATPMSAVQLDGRDADGTVLTAPVSTGSTMQVSLSSFPVLIELAAGTSQRSVEPQQPSSHGNVEEAGKTSPADQGAPVVTITTLDPEAEPAEDPEPANKVSAEGVGVSLPSRHQPEPTIPQISLGPIPATDQVTIQLGDEIDPDEIYRLAVLDLMGRQHISQVKNIHKTNYIQVGHLSPGSYKFMVFFHDGRQYAQTVIITD